MGSGWVLFNICVCGIFFQSGCQASVLLHHLVRSLVPIIICILYLWIRVCRLGCVANLLGRGVYIHEVWCHYVWWAGGISHSFLYGGKHCVMWLYMKHVTIACLKSVLALEFILSRFGSHWDCVRTRSLKSSLIVDFKYASRVDTLDNMFIVLYLCMVLLFYGYSLLAWILIQGHTPMYTMPFFYICTHCFEWHTLARCWAREVLGLWIPCSSSYISLRTCSLGIVSTFLAWIFVWAHAYMYIMSVFYVL